MFDEFIANQIDSTQKALEAKRKAALGSLTDDEKSVHQAVARALHDIELVSTFEESISRVHIKVGPRDGREAATFSDNFERRGVVVIHYRDTDEWKWQHFYGDFEYDVVNVDDAKKIARHRIIEGDF